MVAGPAPISYADLVRHCAAAIGRSVIILPLPTRLLLAALRLTRLVRLPMPIDEAEIRRTGETKSFDVADLRHRLGVTPRGFVDGLRLKLERGWAR